MAENRGTPGKQAFFGGKPNGPNQSGGTPKPISIKADGPEDRNVVKRHVEEPWWKKHLNVLILVGAGVVVFGLFIVLGIQLGWFGGAAEESRPAPVVAKIPATTVKPRNEPKPEKKAEVKKVEAKKPVPVKPAVTEVKKEVKKIEPKAAPLPDDVKQWKKADYLRARKENSPRLISAIEYLGKTFSGSEPAGRGLVDLLEPIPDHKPNAGDAKKRVGAIIEALGLNATPPAREALAGILAGTVATDDDRSAVEAAVKALAANPSDEGDAVLIRLMTETAKFRKPRTGDPWPVKELQAKSLEWLKTTASFRLRTALAEWLIARPGGLDTRGPIGLLLMENDPRNCGSQLMFYERSDVSGDVKSIAEKNLRIFSGVAILSTMGVPANWDKPANAENERKSEPPFPTAHVSGKLWSEAFARVIEPQLGRNTFERQGLLAVLAASIPRESLRAAFAKNLKKRWNEGPKDLEKAGLLDGALDPGLLLAIKVGGPRRDKDAAGAKPAAGRRPPPLNAARAAEQTKREQAEKDWLDTSSKLVDAWRKRLNAAAEARVKGSNGSETVNPPDGFRLPEDAVIKASYRLAWPDDAPPEIAALDLGPLDVHYFRIEESGQIKKLKGSWIQRANARMDNVRKLDKSLWIDTLRSTGDTGRMRSVDVIITRTSGGVAEIEKNNDLADYSIEVVIVEANNPLRD